MSKLRVWVLMREVAYEFPDILSIHASKDGAIGRTSTLSLYQATGK